MLHTSVCQQPCSPFGAPLSKRKYALNGLRRGFNSQERDDEVYGAGNSYTAEYWQYDSRLGRRWNIDPMFTKYPFQSPYSCFNNAPLYFGDPLGLQGDNPPAGHKEYKGVDEQPLYLPTNATTETYKKTEDIALASKSNIKIKAKEGAVRSFTINKDRYVASYDKATGEFVGYKNFKTGNIYQNPKGLTSEGSVSESSWGETQGLYPLTNTTNPSARELYNPANWDYNKSQELLKARAAVDYIANNRNDHVRLDKVNSNDNLEKTVSVWHLNQNLPPPDKEISDNPNVNWFYLSNKSDFITPSIDQRYWNVSIVKSYGPFYNVGGGDAPKGPMYLIFYSATKK